MTEARVVRADAPAMVMREEGLAKTKVGVVDPQALNQQLEGTSVGRVPLDPLHTIFESAFDGVWLVAADGRTSYANGTMAALLGSTQDEMRDRPITDFVDKSLWPEVEAYLRRERTHAGEQIELRFRRADGTELFGLVTASAIRTKEGDLVGTVLDVGDLAGQRSHNAQTVHSQRLEAIGLFAAGIIHDFNNLLTANQGYAQLARASLPEGDPIREDLDQVLASGARASAITRKLLAFSRRQIPVAVDIDPAQVITDLLPILGPLLGDEVDIVLDLGAEHGWIRMDPTEFEQVIVNLTVNARDAMPTGGTVTIAVHDLKETDPDRPDPELSVEPSARISVSDTGTGMDEAVRARIFDPFFTTKSPGKGTGLGLSTVLGIVAKSDGRIQVETAPGLGSAFHVDLPRAEAVELPRPRDRPEPTTRSGIVLLAEDDPSVREFARRSLEAAGYTVLVADGANQALQASANWGEGIDVLLTDIVMPGVHGLELATRIRAQRPAIGVVFMSGYAEGALGDGRDSHVSGEFLPKPFSVEVLRQAVGRAAAGSRR